MKKVGFLLFIVALVAGLVLANATSWGKASGKAFFDISFGDEKGSGKIASEKRIVSGFNRIDTSGIFEVDVVVGSEFSVEVEADDNLLQYVKTELDGNELEISLSKRVKTKNPLRVRITAPSIDGIEASGVSRVKVANLKNTELVIDTSGASRVEVSGESERLVVDVSGASKVNASDLRVLNASVDGSGASKVSLNVVEILVADVSGASHVSYTGSPQINKKTSGAGKVSQE